MPRRCRHCREYNIPKSAPKEDSFCTYECKVAYAMAAVNKSRQQRAKLEKQKRSRQKKEFYNNDYRHQFNLSKKSAQRLAVLLDVANGCISCGTMADTQYCGGHFKSAGSHPELALDLRNIFKQCNRYCNCSLSGNIAGNKTSRGYRAGLLESYGPGIVEYLEAYHPPKKYTCEELIAMRKEFNAEIRRIQKGLGPSRDWRKLPEQQTQEKAA